MQKLYDTLGLGCVATDEVLYVDNFTLDGKTRVLDRQRRLGGTAANALAAAAKAGVKAAYGGILGDDIESQFAIQALKEANIDLRPLRFAAEARPIRSTIVVDATRQTRTILFDLNGAMGAGDSAASAAGAVPAAKVLLVDTLGMAGMIRAAQLARQWKIPVVADFESDATPLFGELLDLVDHLILAEGFACKITGADSPLAACSRLAAPCRKAVVVTCGAAGGWFLVPSESGEFGEPRRFPAFAAPPGDTTGCGDVFHGVYAAGLAAGLPFPERMRRAAAAAAMTITLGRDCHAFPSSAEIDEFLVNHSTWSIA